MAFRVVWPGRFGEDSSQLMDGLEGARLIADALTSYLKIVYVIDAETNEIVYSRRHDSETRLRAAAHRIWTQRSLLVKLTHRPRSVQSRKSSAVNSGFPHLLSLSGRH